MFTTYLAETLEAHQATPAARRTPPPVRAGRALAIGHGLVLLGLGCLLLRGDEPRVSTALATATAIEGLVRVVVGVCLRRGAHVARVVALVIAGLGIMVGITAGGLALIGAILSAGVAVALNTDDAKRYFAR